MNKIEYVRAYYDLFDYLFWIDDDAFFMRLEQRLEDFLPRNGSYLSICASPVINGIYTYVSSGQFMLECSPLGRSFIDETLRVDLDQVSEWWSDEWGYFTRGDQDCFVYLMKTDGRFAHYDRHDYSAFNSRVEHVTSGENVFILHITGTVPVKKKKYEYIQRHFSRGPSLLPPAEAARWKLVERATIPVRVARRLRNMIRAKL